MTFEPLHDFLAGTMKIYVFNSIGEMARAAAINTSAVLTDAIRKKGRARVIFATGNSQLQFVTELCEHTDVRWSNVTAFHMDEYVGMGDNHSASFRRWIRERVEVPLQPAAVHYINGEAEDFDAECRRYESLLKEAPIDLICLGIGENGHIAFNDPSVANFEDPVWVKMVELDMDCRLQQVGEGHFTTLDDVPTHALTLTIPALLAPQTLQAVVPESRKAEAVRKTVTDPITVACPATILRQQQNTTLFLDTDSASSITEVGGAVPTSNR